MKKVPKNSIEATALRCFGDEYRRVYDSLMSIDDTMDFSVLCNRSVDDLHACVQCDRGLEVDYGSQLFNNPNLAELTDGFPEDRYRPGVQSSIDILVIQDHKDEEIRGYTVEPSVAVETHPLNCDTDVVPSIPPKPIKKLESVSDDDWNDTPSIPPKPVKKRESVSDDDWNDTPSIPPKAVKKLESVSDDDWNHTPSIPPKPVKKLESVSDDDWNDTPPKPIKKQDSSHPSVDAEAASQRKTSRRAMFERIGRKSEKGLSIPKKTPPPSLKPSLSEVSSQSKKIKDDESPNGSDSSFDWETFWGESSKKPLPPLPTASKPKLSNESKWSDDELSDEWSATPSKPMKKLESVSDDDWNDVPIQSKSKKESVDDDWSDTPSQSKSKKEEIDDDWSDIPPKPMKKLESVSDDDWNTVPSIPAKPMKKRESVSDDDWNTVPSIPAKPMKKLESVSDDDWNTVPSIPAKPIKKLESVSDDDWNTVPSIPAKPMKKLESVNDDDWNTVPSIPAKPMKKRESVSDDDWNDLPLKPKKEPIDDDWDTIPPKPESNKVLTTPTRRQSAVSIAQSHKSSKPVLSNTSSDWSSDDELPVNTERREPNASLVDSQSNRIRPTGKLSSESSEKPKTSPDSSATKQVIAETLQRMPDVSFFSQESLLF